MPESRAVEPMFGKIALRYERVNHLLSLGLDIGWRRKLLKRAATLKPAKALDVACGTGQIAIGLAKIPSTSSVIGADFCKPMLAVAEAKKQNLGLPHLSFTHADAMELPFKDGHFDLVTLAFGLRNFESRPRGLSEIKRVLRIGGRILILEFSQPWSCFWAFYKVYLERVLPKLGGYLTGQRAAYAYLTDSIQSFPEAERLAEELRQAGFRGVAFKTMGGGLVRLHEGFVEF